MASPLRLDHLVVKVDDLASAGREWTGRGFTVTPGGEHPGRGSRNALVVLADGSYLELISFEDARPAPDATASGPPSTPGGADPLDRWERWRRSPPGLVDLALLPDGIEETIAAARRRGLAIHGPLPGGRRRPDGLEVSWLLGLPDGFDLPFLCADLTPRVLRVPEGAAREHPCRARGIAGVVVAARDLPRSRERWQALLGYDPLPGGAEFALGSAHIRLESATGPEGPRSYQFTPAAATRRRP